MRYIFFGIAFLLLGVGCGKAPGPVAEPAIVSPVELDASLKDEEGEPVPIKVEIKGTGGDIEILGPFAVSVKARQWEFEPSVIHVPAHRSVVLEIESEDVNHGFAIPKLGVQSFLTAGQTTDVEIPAADPGVYLFACSVLCGKGHGQMTGTLIVE